MALVSTTQGTKDELLCFDTTFQKLNADAGLSMGTAVARCKPDYPGRNSYLLTLQAQQEQQFIAQGGRSLNRNEQPAIDHERHVAAAQRRGLL